MNIPILKRKIEIPIDKPYKILIISDIHIGADDFNQRQFDKFMQKHYDNIDEIIILGDIFDAIFTKDKRYQPSSNKFAEFDAQSNKAIDMAFDILEPYSNKISMLGYGNHEYSIIKYGSTDLLAWLSDKLNSELDCSIELGGYMGYIYYNIDIAGNHTQTYKLLYSHGRGGNAPITKGMIDISRMKTNFIYDGFFFGHKHSNISDKDIYIDINKSGNLEQHSRISAQVGTFKNQVFDSNNIDFAALKNFSPASDGGLVLELSTETDGNKYKLNQNVRI